MDLNWQLARKRSLLEKRARIVQTIRAFFIEHEFLEVETPQRIPTNAPELHIDAVATDGWYLQTSPELAMKRLLAAGYGNIYQLSHCWRAGERGTRHLPEYSMLEWYRPHCDYHSLMQDCELLLARLVPDLKLVYQGNCIDLTPPWPRLSVADAFSHYASCTLQEGLNNERFDEIISLEIEPRLPVDRPTVLYEYPRTQASLARISPDDPRSAERFELYLAGMELANAFSELNDPEEQRRRFTEEETRRQSAGKTRYPVPEAFLNELATMPPSAGIALGVDRLVMLLSDSVRIDDVVAFIPEQL